jgi:hypothetical protein
LAESRCGVSGFRGISIGGLVFLQPLLETRREGYDEGGDVFIQLLDDAEYEPDTHSSITGKSLGSSQLMAASCRWWPVRSAA